MSSKSTYLEKLRYIDYVELCFFESFYDIHIGPEPVQDDSPRFRTGPAPPTAKTAARLGITEQAPEVQRPYVCMNIRVK